jgi:hypothetical protein
MPIRDTCPDGGVSTYYYYYISLFSGLCLDYPLHSTNIAYDLTLTLSCHLFSDTEVRVRYFPSLVNHSTYNLPSRYDRLGTNILSCHLFSDTEPI